MDMTVGSLWRYPVKSMHGEQLDCIALTSNGVAGDRRYAFDSSGAPAGMLRLTGSERRAMLRFRASIVDGATMVRMPDGLDVEVDDARLLSALPSENTLTLTYRERPQTDCRPLALISRQTVQALSDEMGKRLDPRRFRANIYLDVDEPFAEEQLVGMEVRIGGEAVIRITERDPRCRFITLDPETTEPMPQLMKLLDRRHQGRAGIYAAVVTPGLVQVGDPCVVLPAQLS